MIHLKEEPKINIEPRFSITKLANYLNVSSAKRKKLTEDQKYPPKFKQIFYKRAAESIVRHFTENSFNSEFLLDEIEDLASIIPKNNFEKIRVKNCIAAITQFYNDASKLQFLEEYKCSSGLTAKSIVEISGVKISVRPEVIFKTTGKSSKQFGAVKLYFGKDKPLTKDEGETIAAMLEMYLESILPKGYSLPTKYCIVVDVFNGNKFYPPKAMVRKLNDITAACEEIALRWESL